MTSSRVHPHPPAPSPIKREGEQFSQAHLRRLLRTALLYFVLTIMLILFLVPVYGVIVTAFKSAAEVATQGYWTPPAQISIDNFARVMDPEQGNLSLYLGNSVLLTIPASLLSIGLGTLAGYGLGKYRFKLDGLLFIFIVAGMFPAAADRADPGFPLDERLWSLRHALGGHHHSYRFRHPHLYAGDAQLFPGGCPTPCARRR